MPSFFIYSARACVLPVLFVSLLFFSCQKEESPYTNYDYIIAGDRNSSGIFYTDISDFNTSVIQSSGSHRINYYRNYNLDGNASIDVRFHTWSVGALGGDGIGTSISSINTYEIAIDEYDSGRYGPIVINRGDTINRNLSYKNVQRSPLFYSSRNGSSFSIGGFWSNEKDKFIGVRTFSSKDTLYGWIRLDLRGGNITIKDFAVRN